MEAIFAALIGSVTSIIVCVLTMNAQNKKVIAELDKYNAIQHEQIKELDKKVEKHNKVIERVYKLESSDQVEKEQIKVINHRIDDLESYHK